MTEKLPDVETAAELTDMLIQQLQVSLQVLDDRQYWQQRPAEDSAGPVLDIERGTLGRLDFMRSLDHEVDAVRRALVAEARAEGRSWDQVGRAIGASRQAAWERFGSREPRRPIRRDADPHVRTRSAAGGP